MTKLSKAQKVIFLMVFAVAAAVFVFWTFIYSPATSNMKRLEDEYKGVEFEIKKIEDIIQKENGLESAYKKFYERKAYLDKIIPAEYRSALSALSSEAGKLGIEVVSVKPDKIKMSDLGMTIDGKPLSEIAIEINMKCGYEALGEYLNILREKLPALLTVDSVSMGLISRDTPYLNTALKITLYIVERQIS